MKKLILNLIRILLLIISPTLLCSCWDYMDLDRRGYVLGVGIDKVDSNDSQSNEFKTAPMESGVPEYAYSIQIPIISRAQNKPAGQNGSGSEQDKSWLVQIYGNSFFEVNREYATRLDYPPFYAHLQAIIISEDVARDGIAKPLDLFIRDPEIRRRTRIFITPGSALDVLQVSPKIDDYSAMYLSRLVIGAKRTSRMLHKTDLGEVTKALHGKNDFVLPRVISKEYEIKNAGCAVFKEGKMVGWLDEISTAYLKWIGDVALGGTVAVNIDGRENEAVTLEIKKVKTQQRPRIDGNKIIMTINTTATMHISELSLNSTGSIINDEFIKNIEQLAEEKVKKEMKQTIKLVQSEYGADVFFFYKAMSRYEPEAWAKVKNNWREAFVSVIPEINVKIKIDQAGLVD
jgi:Ger(x)C family germination protein